MTNNEEKNKPMENNPRLTGDKGIKTLIINVFKN